MTRSFRSSYSSAKLKALLASPVARLVALVVVLSSSYILCTIAGTIITIEALKTGNLPRAQAAASLTQPLVRGLDRMTLQRVADLSAWQLTLKAVAELPYKNGPSQALSEYIPLSETLRELSGVFPKSTLSQSLLPEQARILLSSVSPAIQAAPEILSELSEGTQKWLVLFQNNDELRATGGFMGSYAVVTLQNGVLTEIVIEDIYDADGQFTGFVAAPPGAKEYLSSGNGLRLPDANWSPDFPSSAQQIMQFFALGDRSGISGVIAINQEVLREILRITGPVPLPDYDATLTAETLDSVLRNERDVFFPGSIQKKHLLSHAQTQLRIALSQLTTTELLDLAEQLSTRVQYKDIQVFALSEQLQKRFSALGITGELSVSPQLFGKSGASLSAPPGRGAPPDLYLSVIESNVGINKANAGVTRQHTVSLAPEKTLLTITWQNQNTPRDGGIDPFELGGSATPSARTTALQQALRDSAPELISPDSATHMAYVNYLRVFVAPDFAFSSATFAGAPIITWNDTLITTAGGEQFREIGLLVIVPEQSQTKLELTLQNSATLESALRNASPITLVLQKQSGIGSVPYSISSPVAFSDFIFDHDVLIKLE